MIDRTPQQRNETRIRQVVACAMFALCAGAVHAETVKIVAFGGSNTFGKNLSRSLAYPAQLEALLKAKGYDVVVANEGTNGQSTTEELGRLDSAVPQDTRIVIFQPGGNDKRKGDMNSVANIKAIVQRLIDRHIRVLFSGGEGRRAMVAPMGVDTIDEIARLAPDDMQFDGQHLTEKGYRKAAEAMLPAVEAMLQSLQPR